MNIIQRFTDDLNKTILNGIEVGRKEVNKSIDSVGSNTRVNINKGANEINSNITTVQQGVKSVLRNVDNNINNTINKGVKGYISNVDNLEKNISTESPRSTSFKTVKTYSSFLDSFYEWLFKILIKPYNPTVRMTFEDYSFVNIIRTFILLLITTTNNYIVENTIEKVINSSEKAIGYKLDGRRIGKKKKSRDAKIPMILKIIKTILHVIATLLDLILMAFLNQTDVFANIVKDLLGKS
jgi:hypothetical protein